jgi:hypothetical protein
MTPDLRWQGLERTPASPAPLFEPRRVHEPNKEEREDDEEQDHAGQQHNRAEHPTQVRLECDVSEAERAHHRERPVDPREPRVILALPSHDYMENPAVQQHDRDHEDDVSHERRELPAQSRAPGDERGEVSAHRLHAVSTMGQWTVADKRTNLPGFCGGGIGPMGMGRTRGFRLSKGSSQRSSPAAERQPVSAEFDISPKLTNRPAQQPPAASRPAIIG